VGGGVGRGAANLLCALDGLLPVAGCSCKFLTAASTLHPDITGLRRGATCAARCRAARDRA